MSQRTGRNPITPLLVIVGIFLGFGRLAHDATATPPAEPACTVEVTP